MLCCTCFSIILSLLRVVLSRVLLAIRCRLVLPLLLFRLLLGFLYIRLGDVSAEVLKVHLVHLFIVSLVLLLARIASPLSLIIRTAAACSLLPTATAVFVVPSLMRVVTDAQMVVQALPRYTFTTAVALYLLPVIFKFLTVLERKVVGALHILFVMVVLLCRLLLLDPASLLLLQLLLCPRSCERIQILI
jgi:hypothetical protein